MTPEETAAERHIRATAIAEAGGVGPALASGALPRRLDLTLSEAAVLGLLLQDVGVFLTVLGHGSTEIGEVLRIYEAAGLLHTHGVHHETLAAHAATALRWVTGEKAAVVTSIGPGALHALAGSLASASDGIGVWHLYGDETTEDEGPNMQQVPKHAQGLFLQLAATLGDAYSLHTPQAVGSALRRGMVRVDHPHRAGPFFLLLPLNTQPSLIHSFNLDELPAGRPPALAAAASGYEEAAAAIAASQRVVVKVGGGARSAGPEIIDLLTLADAVAVTSPLASGVVPFDHPRNMTVGGSKGSISGNYAMEEANLLIAVGTRSVCQSDCSRTGYPNVRQVVSINTDLDDAMHYARTTALVGDAAGTLHTLNSVLRARTPAPSDSESEWFIACREARRRWDAHRADRYANPVLHDDEWGRKVLTQPAAIEITTRWARAQDAVCFFDAGDVQANGFQIVEDTVPGRTFTETGASYMGFAASALLATGLASDRFFGVALTGDGSLLMQPQILVDGVQHHSHGVIVLLDNRRMGAIVGLQESQYGPAGGHATDHLGIAINWAALAGSVPGLLAIDGGNDPGSLESALDAAGAYDGLSLVHVPVYFGDDPIGGMGAFGRWNVGNEVIATQSLRHEIGL